MMRQQILYDYTMVVTTCGIYNELAERDLDWKEQALNDEWPQTLMKLTKKYNIKYEKTPDKTELVYHLENIIVNHLTELILNF